MGSGGEDRASSIGIIERCSRMPGMIRGGAIVFRWGPRSWRPGPSRSASRPRPWRSSPSSRHPRANEELRQLSTTDGLTQLANRRYLDDYLRREWRRHLKHGLPLVIALCDIDYFKQYNDTYGHLDGDRCLVGVARALDAAAGRKADLVARYGGEEFAVVLPDTDEKGARSMIDKIRSNIEALAIPHARSEAGHHVTISIGVYQGVPSSADVATALSAADQCLYAAKSSGRDCAVLNAVMVTRSGV